MVDDLTTNLLNIKPEINSLSSISDSPTPLSDNCNESLIKDEHQNLSVPLTIDSTVFSQSNSTNSTSRFESSAASTASSLTPKSSNSLAPFFQHLDRLMEAARSSSINDGNDNCIQNDLNFSNDSLLNSSQKNNKLQNNLNEQHLFQLFQFLSNASQHNSSKIIIF